MLLLSVVDNAAPSYIYSNIIVPYPVWCHELQVHQDFKFPTLLTWLILKVCISVYTDVLE